MNRRDTVLALLALGAPLPLRAQPYKVPRRIGWLTPGSTEASASFGAFTAKMKELGNVEGRDYVIERRESESRLDRLPALVKEIVASNPAVIVTAGSSAVAAFKKETGILPIVFGSASDVVEQGFVASFARPGGNITGVTLRSEVNGKLVQLIRETLPSARRIALLEVEGEQITKRNSDSFRGPALTLGFQLSIVRVKRAEDFEHAFAEMGRSKAEALIVRQMPLLVRHGKLLTELALKARLPLFGTHSFAREGGLLSYHSDTTENYRRVAVMVDKILKGAKPAELPVEQPDRYSLIVNLVTAKALGITVPQSVLVRADEAIR